MKCDDINEFNCFSLINITFNNNHGIFFFIYSFLDLIKDNNCSSIIQFVNLKYKCIKKLLDTNFYSELSKTLCINVIGETFKVTNAFSKLVSIYRLKKTTPIIATDLSLDTIYLTQKSTITIIENNSIYLFKNTDLLKLINNSLSLTDNFFVNSKFPANPYTNLPFSNASLYNIYFKLKESCLTISILFHQFFLCNFCLTEFKLNNEFIIREHSFKQFINFGFNEKIIQEIKFMLKDNFWSKKWIIHKDFPKNDFLFIFKPILINFLRLEYGNTTCELYYDSKKKLSFYLEKMFKYNPKFGRKQFNDKTKNYYFDTTYLPFKELKNQEIHSLYEPYSSINAFNYNEYIQMLNSFRLSSNIDDYDYDYLLGVSDSES
jgi:hypothetical protein